MRDIAILFLTVCLCAAAGRTRAAERLDIEPVAYKSGAEAAAAWKPMEGSAPAALAPERTPDGRPALAFRCDMARLETRAYWDRSVPLDLSRCGRVAFWVKLTGDPAAIAGATLYFNAGAGWYGAPFGTPEEGWRRVVLDRGAFKTEDAPEGWNVLRTIRLAFWKGQPRSCTVYLGAMEATSSDVVVVRNTRAGREAETWVEQTASALARAGVDAGTVDDADVERGVLEGKKIAVYPLNPQPSEKEMDAVEAFVRAGGKLVVCFNLPPRMAALLGVEDRGYMQPEYAGQFSAMHFRPGGPPGLPAEAKQASWNIERARPAGKNARVLADWFDKDGKDTGYPAILLSDTGAFISHVLLNDDPQNKDRLLRALLGHLWPGLWESLARNALAQAGSIAPRWQTFAEAMAGVQEAAQRANRADAVKDALAQAKLAYQTAESEAKAGRYPACLNSASRAKERLLAAYIAAQRARAGEFRAVWCHNAYGVEGMTWDRAIRRLKENGFNAIVPNMLWGGVADYRSEVLPVRDRVARDGDQIALCVAAGKKYGVEVHVWKVNWNLGGAPETFVAKMRAEGRLQRTSSGAEELWLCPSNPANFRLERDAMLEVTRKYDVDGIHFDYIRYPDGSKCYCDGCRARFEAETSAKVADWPKDVLRGGPRYAAYQEFRRANITRLVKAVSEEARRIRPGIKISAAVFANWPQCREEVGQDWGRWVKEGYLDFVCPMDYTASDTEYRTLVQVQRDEVAGRIPLYPGVGASAPGLPLAQVMDQIGIGRANGADGFIIFNYDGPVASEYVPALGKGLTAGETLAPHNAPKIVWKVQQGGKPLAGAARAGAPVQVEAVLPTSGVAGVVISACALDDSVVQEIGRGKAGGTVTGEVRLARGLYRLAAKGFMTRADGTRREFVARGPFVRVEGPD
jgi:uncharacterized lipoprotein YddW (UPF0748 family)